MDSGLKSDPTGQTGFTPKKLGPPRCFSLGVLFCQYSPLLIYFELSPRAPGIQGRRSLQFTRPCRCVLPPIAQVSTVYGSTGC